MSRAKVIRLSFCMVLEAVGIYFIGGRRREPAGLGREMLERKDQPCYL